MASNVLQPAHDVAQSGVTNVLWSIMNDSWCPATNPQECLDLPPKYLTIWRGGHGSLRLRRAIAQFLTRQLHPRLLSNRFMVFGRFSKSIFLGKPYYGSLIPHFALRPGSNVVPVKFGDSDPLSLQAVYKYEKALLDLLRLCQKYGAHLISDDIYALYPPAVPFESDLSIDPTGIIDPWLVHVLWGMSKDFGANGLCLGAIISQGNSELHVVLKETTSYTIHPEAKLSRINYAPGCNAALFLSVYLGKRHRELYPEDDDDEDISEKMMGRFLTHKSDMIAPI
ncbi:hypothetical protein BDV59DRAFT_192176 [Aspergillus ambiguus]|uniref:uncharacterized protein n=1 Tax=Aspergillus ambiguus TaxID=176160 RepID=UPI003CCDF911